MRVVLKVFFGAQIGCAPFKSELRICGFNVLNHFRGLVFCWRELLLHVHIYRDALIN
jgi:hypothetical protein